MTTELYPYIGPDMTYEKQRKCRMQDAIDDYLQDDEVCLLYTSPSPRDQRGSRMPSSA